MKLPDDSMWSNIIVTLLTLIYVALILQIGLLLKNLYPERTILSRKFIHICASTWILFWPLFDQSHWTWMLNISVPVVISFKLLLHVSFCYYYYFCVDFSFFLC